MLCVFFKIRGDSGFKYGKNDYKDFGREGNLVIIK